MIGVDVALRIAAAWLGGMGVAFVVAVLVQADAHARARMSCQPAPRFGRRTLTHAAAGVVFWPVVLVAIVGTTGFDLVVAFAVAVRGAGRYLAKVGERRRLDPSELAEELQLREETAP